MANKPTSYEFTRGSVSLRRTGIGQARSVRATPSNEPFVNVVNEEIDRIFKEINSDITMSLQLYETTKRCAISTVKSSGPNIGQSLAYDVEHIPSVIQALSYTYKVCGQSKPQLREALDKALVNLTEMPDTEV